MFRAEVKEAEMSNLMPMFARQADGTTIPTWPDENDGRWLVAAFLSSDIGFAVENIDEVLTGLLHVTGGELESWQWDGNSFRLRVSPRGASLTLCDSDRPCHSKPLDIPITELREIMQSWKKQLEDR
jgi:hypothetical protein